MKILKIALAVLAAAFIVMQFIRPEPNAGVTDSPDAIHNLYTVPGDVQRILNNSCYDCHTNATDYPWYAAVQPAGWLLDSHIRDGKKHLNFSEFGTYRLRLQSHKLEEVERVLEEDEMPLPSYLLIHWGARLSPEQKSRLIAWSQELRDTIEQRNARSSGLP